MLCTTFMIIILYTCSVCLPFLNTSVLNKLQCSSITQENVCISCILLQEAHVYRCALMCAQFPMLSAPDPPEGASPTPPPPSLPLRFTNVIGSAASAARTAPDDFLTSIPADKITGTTTIPNNSHVQPRQQAHHMVNGLGLGGEPELNHDLSDRQKKNSKHPRTLTHSSSTGSKDSRVSVDMVDSAEGMNGAGDRPNPSEPIPIRTGILRPIVYVLLFTCLHRHLFRLKEAQQKKPKAGLSVPCEW